jgi:uncharacterized membrane protein (UPF0127 family)
MEVLCRLSYSGLFLGVLPIQSFGAGHDTERPTRFMAGVDPWDHGSMRLVLVLLLAAVACGSADVPNPSATAALSIRTDDGTVSLDVQVADTPDERQIGLMGRESLSPYDGMAFLWEAPVESSFWMKDTLIPLSIAFWDQGGRIISILDMDPCTEDPCPSYGPDEPFVGAVEVDRGTLEDRGVALGDQVELTVPNR